MGGILAGITTNFYAKAIKNIQGITQEESNAALKTVLVAEKDDYGVN